MGGTAGTIRFGMGLFIAANLVRVAASAVEIAFLLVIGHVWSPFTSETIIDPTGCRRCCEKSECGF
jgi:hypothetical protein